MSGFQGRLSQQTDLGRGLIEDPELISVSHTTGSVIERCGAAVCMSLKLGLTRQWPGEVEKRE